MIFRYVATALLTTALMTGVASAQTTTTNKADASSTSATMHKEGEWRASKLLGINVYNDANEKIGDINEVILDKSGKVANVILGVGGFLGVGEHYVAIAFDKLKWVDEPVRSMTVSTSSPSKSTPATNVDSNVRTATDGTPRTTTGAATMSNVDRSASDYWYPDHAVYSATKDQLKTMPQFKY